MMMMMMMTTTMMTMTMTFKGKEKMWRNGILRGHNPTYRDKTGKFNSSRFSISQIGSFPQVGLKIKNVWNHHLPMMTQNTCLFTTEILAVLAVPLIGVGFIRTIWSSVHAGVFSIFAVRCSKDGFGLCCFGDFSFFKCMYIYIFLYIYIHIYIYIYIYIHIYIYMSWSCNAILSRIVFFANSLGKTKNAKKLLKSVGVLMFSAINSEVNNRCPNVVANVAALSAVDVPVFFDERILKTSRVWSRKYLLRSNVLFWASFR